LRAGAFTAGDVTGEAGVGRRAGFAAEAALARDVAARDVAAGDGAALGPVVGVVLASLVADPVTDPVTEVWGAPVIEAVPAGGGALELSSHEARRPALRTHTTTRASPERTTFLVWCAWGRALSPA
jgi:hypothetical protein